jgi:hypothetical protein
VGRLNGGTLADLTARAMQEPAGVPTKGDATLAVETRPELENVIVTLAVPRIP